MTRETTMYEKQFTKISNVQNQFEFFYWHFTKNKNFNLKLLEIAQKNQKPFEISFYLKKLIWITISNKKWKNTITKYLK